MGLTRDYWASSSFSHKCLSLLIILLGQNNIDKIMESRSCRKALFVINDK